MSSFIFAGLPMMARSVANITSYITELNHSKEIIIHENQKTFDAWLAANYNELYVIMSIYYLTLIGLRNISLILNLTRWFIVEAGL